MSGKTLERQQSTEYLLAEEQKALREIQQIREQQENAVIQDRVLYFEESGSVRIVSYSDTLKETVSRDPEGKEHVDLEELTINEKNELDSMYDLIAEHELEEINMNDLEIPEFDDE